MRHSTNSTIIVRVIFIIAVLLLVIVFTVYSEETALFARNALSLCAEAVIPSLFPFMVLSSMASRFSALLTAKNHPALTTAIPIILGFLCGFPVGAATVAMMYENKAFAKSKAERFCALCNNTGPAFIVGVIGRTFWRSAGIGMIFYVCQLISAITVFGICRCLFSRSLTENTVESTSTISAADAGESFSLGFCRSVAESSVSIVKVCGFIIFFKVFCDMFIMFLPDTYISRAVFTVVSVIFEFTTGSAAASELGGAVGIFLCGFSVGFSGLSVMAQSAEILRNSGLSSLPLLLMKIPTGLLCGILSTAAYLSLDISETVYSTPADIHTTLWSSLTLLIVILYFLLSFSRRALVYIRSKTH